jgi:divalent metal cation (Fe/Co/Zn/Cd) transporter
VALAAGEAAESVALLGFGIDSLIELLAGIAALWRLGAELDAGRRERSEHAARRIVGTSFLLLAGYVAFEAVRTLATHQAPAPSPVGIGLAAASLMVMPLLAAAKRRVATDIGSLALVLEARQTTMCAMLSAILLGGLALNATVGWWWSDPIAALAMVPFIGREGLEGWEKDLD